MSKEITKAIILQEIQDKLKLREFAPANFLFDETVVPIYDIEKHLQTQVVDMASKSIISAPTSFLFFTVPENEKWSFSRYDIVFMAAGAYTTTGAFIKHVASPVVDRTIYLDMLAGQSVSYHTELPQPVILSPGDSISVYVDSYVSTADLRLYIEVTKEEVR